MLPQDYHGEHLIREARRLDRQQADKRKLQIRLVRAFRIARALELLQADEAGSDLTPAECITLNRRIREME